MIIQYDSVSAFANRSLSTNFENLKKSAEKLGSGYRINRAADDAAGLTISEKMRWQIRGLKRASQNIQDGCSLIQVADGALSEVHSILQRMNELSVQAANDTNTDSDREAIQNEIDSLKEEINRISVDTTFNTIRIFKPTNVPEVSGSPTDILVYNEDYNGSTRIGGIIYNGKRYSYEDLGIATDSSGNIKAGEYTISVEGETGDDVSITLLFDGTSRTPSGRKYELTVEDDGIAIDGIVHKWSNIKETTTGDSFDKNNITAGTYSFEHAGLTITFEVEEDMDFDSFKDAMQPDGLTTYEILSDFSKTSSTKVTPYVSVSSVNVTTGNVDYIPQSTSKNTISGGYKMLADENGVTMYIPAAYSSTGKQINLTTMTWDELGLPDSVWTTGGGVNPNSSVGVETSSTYTYKDSYTGIEITFTVDSEASKQELINAINNWSITPTTNTYMSFTPTTSGNYDTTISLYSYSSSLDMFGTQYNMGRVMGTQMTLQSGMKLTENGDDLYFTMTDNNNVTYTFTADDVKDTITTDVTGDLSSYISAYATAYASLLNNAQSENVGTPSPYTSTYYSYLKFNSDNGGYNVNLRYTESFAGWISKDNFDVSYTETTDANGVTTKTYTVKAKDGLIGSLSSNISNTVTDIYNALTNTSMTVKTDSNTTHVTNPVQYPTTTKNASYTSVVNAGDREMNIQAGALEGQVIVIELPAMNTSTLGISGIDVSTQEGASASITNIQSAIDKVSEMRSKFGAKQNRLEAAMSVNDITRENTQYAESLLRDADMAEEMVSYSRHNILVSAGQSVLAQANRNRDYILTLIQ